MQRTNGDAKRESSVSSTDSLWVLWAVLVLTAVVCIVADVSSDSGKDVPEIAEVDVVVEVGVGLRDRSGSNLAVKSISGELKELVIGVFAVVGNSLGVDPVCTRVMNAHLTLVLGISILIKFDELSSLANGIGTGGKRDSGINMAASMEGVVIWESVIVSSGDSSDGGEDEGLHI